MQLNIENYKSRKQNQTIYKSRAIPPKYLVIYMTLKLMQEGKVLKIVKKKKKL